jgi:VCBS repeat-containing protein
VSASREITLVAGATVAIDDLYAELAAGSGAGLLRLTGDVRAWVRTYNLGPAGTFGHDVPPVLAVAGFAAGERFAAPFFTAADLATDPRSNLLLVNLEDRELRVELRAGAKAAEVTVPAQSYVQVNLVGDLLGSAPGVDTLLLTADGRWGGYVTTVDPYTGDPTAVRPLAESRYSSQALFAGVADTVGVNLTHWRSETTLYNPADTEATAQLELIPRGDSLPTAVRMVQVAPHATVHLADVYGELGASQGAGMLRVSGALAWARTYNARSDGTCGQDVPPLHADSAFSAGQGIVMPFYTPADLQQDFRSNLVLVNFEDTTTELTLSAGGPVKTISIAQSTYLQIDNLAAFLQPAEAGTLDPAAMAGGQLAAVTITGDGRWAGYITSIDPLTGDPTTVEGLPVVDDAATNLPPEAVDDVVVVSKNVAKTLDVLANDSDPDGDPLMISGVVSPPQHGSATVIAGSSIVYQPQAGFEGGDAFTYGVADGRGGSDTATVTIDVVNDPPVAFSDTITTAENTPYAGTLSGSDPNDDPLTFVKVRDPDHGGVTILGDGSFVYTPLTSFGGSDSFTFRVSDGSLESDVATVTIAVSSVNDPPLAAADTFAVDEDTVLSVAAPGVLGNDSDPDGDALSVSAVAPPAHAASFALAADGSFTYVPAAGYNGPDGFSYQAADGRGGTGAAAVTITVRPVNDAPVAGDGAVTTAEDVAVPVLLSATDADGDPLSYLIVFGPSHGSLGGVAPNLTYTPAADYHGSDAVIFAASDGPASSNTATISITVDPANDAPVGVGDVYGTGQGVALAVVAPGVVGNDADADGDALSAVLVTGPAQAASFALAADGSFAYTPQPGFSGTDGFTYRASDGALTSAPVTVAINVQAGNTAPVANDGTVTTGEETPVAVTLTGSDADGDALSFAIATPPAHGTLVGTPPNLTYVPAVDYAGADGFTFTVSDGVATSAAATVSITVSPANDPPAVDAATFSVAENSANGTVVGSVTFSDPDAGQGHSFAITAGNTGGAFAIDSATGQLTVANGAALDFDVAPSFSLSVQVTDDGVPPLSGTATVTVNLTDANDAPVANAATFAVAENSANGTAVGGVTFSDPDSGQGHVFAITAGNTGGAFAIGAATGQLTVASAVMLNFEVTPSFSLTVRVTDDGVPTLSGTATVTVNLSNVPEAPIVTGESYQTIGNTLLEVDSAPAATGPKVVVSGSLLANDTDPDGPTVLSASFDSASAGAVVSVDTDGTFTYLPPAGASGSDSFVYRVSDGALSSTGTVTINFSNRVWYVRNDAASGGLGRSADPFDTLAEAEVASAANDYLFVYLGDGTTSGQDQGIALKSGQHLIGEHAGLSIPVGLNGGASPTVLVAAAPGSRPLLDDTLAGAPDGIAATDVVPAEIVGLSLAGTVNAIDHTLGAAFTGSETLTISQNLFRGAGAEGLDVNKGGSGTLTLDVQGNSWTTTAADHVGNAVDIRTTLGTLNLAFASNVSITSSQTAVLIDGSGGGTLNVTGFAGNSVHHDTGGTGISISSARFDQTPGGAYQQVVGGTTVVGASGDGVGGAALVLTNVTGDLAFTDLDLFASGGTAFSLTGFGAANLGAGTGTRVTVGSGVGIFEASGGPAIAVSGATVDLQLTTLTSLNSATSGVSLITVSDATNPVSSAVVSAGSGSSITNATGTDFAIDGGNATVSYAGTITDDAASVWSPTRPLTGEKPAPWATATTATAAASRSPTTPARPSRFPAA